MSSQKGVLNKTKIKYRYIYTLCINTGLCNPAHEILYIKIWTRIFCVLCPTSFKIWWNESIQFCGWFLHFVLPWANLSIFLPRLPFGRIIHLELSTNLPQEAKLLGSANPACLRRNIIKRVYQSKSVKILLND